MATETTINVAISASLHLVHDIRLRPLKTRGLRELVSQAEKLIAMNEADRVVKALHQARSNLAAAREVLSDLPDNGQAHRELTRILAATRVLLKKVSGR